ncbi:helix-turn-helix domain-containing protein [Halomonas mongoliensis]|uniref:helix-turn-helix domain-containing protein n=1 Tax=Halomonas mongoliensis TaxID=321265 RepID=UPI00403A9774
MSSAIRQIPLDTATLHHAHDYHQIVIGLEGRAEFEIEGLGGAISALSGCIVPANHVHYYAGSGENRQLILDLPGEAACLTGLHHELARLFDAPRFFALDDPLRRYLDFLLLELEHAPRPLGPGQQERLAGTLLGCLNERLGGSPPAPRGRPLDLTRLDRFIERHLASPLQVGDLAREACMSEAHFRERFRQQTGLSPWQYVRRRRLEAARHLLSATGLPVAEVAARTGFGSQSAFASACRNAFGAPPSRLRQPAERPRPLNRVSRQGRA